MSVYESDNGRLVITIETSKTISGKSSRTLAKEYADELIKYTDKLIWEELARSNCLQPESSENKEGW